MCPVDITFAHVGDGGAVDLKQLCGPMPHWPTASFNVQAKSLRQKRMDGPVGASLRKLHILDIGLLGYFKQHKQPAIFARPYRLHAIPAPH